MDENKTPFWQTYFNERQLKEIDFCRMYATDFGHGATNHNVMLIVSQMAELLDRAVLPFPEQKE
jgi:hypothetical protein